MKKRILAMFMALCLMLSAVPTAFAAEEEDAPFTPNTSWYDENECEFTISSADQLAGLAKLVNEGNDFARKTITLAADIDLEDREWTPIGYGGKTFKGTFDGGEHTISNLVIDQPRRSNVGLFGYTENGEVKNFTLNNAKVTGYLEVGAVAGTPYTSKYTDIAVTGLIEVNGFAYVGGALGKNAYADVTNVDITGDTGSYVNAESGIYRTYVGGLIGFMGEGSHTVSNCDVKIDVMGSTCDVGGILGILHYGNTLVTCTYEGSLTLTDPDADGGDEFGALVGTVHNGGRGPTKIKSCEATVHKATSGASDVTETITPHGDFYSDLTGTDEKGDPLNTGAVTIEATVNNVPVTVDNNVASVGTEAYKTLPEAIEAANAATGEDPVTVTINRSGEYAPFTISRNNVTVEAAKGVEVSIPVSKSGEFSVTANGVALRDLSFTTDDAATIISSGDCNALTLDGCSFININESGEAEGTALYIHCPDITITGCTFENWERGYYTCGDNHAAGAMSFTQNTFTNVYVPIDGYWGKTATDDTDIQITDNTFAAGDWSTAYIQLWDYSQYLRWSGNTDDDRQGSALKATISGNTYRGNVVIYKTHCDWFVESDVTVADAGAKVVKRHLVVLEGVDATDEVTVLDENGSPITAFNESTTSSTRNGKQVIYSISEGNYQVKVQPQDSEGSITAELTVSAQTTGADEKTNTNTLTINKPEDGVKVARVGNTEYASLAEAIAAAANGGTVELLTDVEVDTWNQIGTIGNPAVAINGLTIEGKGHKLTVGKVVSGTNGNYLLYNATNLSVADLTVEFKTNGNGFDMNSGKLENVTMTGGKDSNYAVFVGRGDQVEISDCSFSGFDYGITSGYDEAESVTPTSEIVVTDSEFTDCTYAIQSYAPKNTFTGNTVDASKVNFAATVEKHGQPTSCVVTGNTFEGRVKFYMDELGKIEFTENKMLGDAFLEVTKSSSATDTEPLDISGNYWGGGEPTDDRIQGLEETQVKCDNYYTEPEIVPENKNDYIAGVTLDRTTLTLTVGGSDTLTATVTGNKDANTTVTWSSSNPAVAAVDQKGKVTAVAPGEATITATANGDKTKTATCAVTVKPDSVSAESVTLSETTLTLEIGDTETLTATVTPADTTDTVEWSSSDETVATVENGVVTAVGRGTATITATAGGASATCTVEVQRTYIPIPPTQPTRPTKPAEPDEPDEPDEPVESELPFTDVDVEDEFYEAVKYVSENGLMTGVDTTAFAPYSEFTRAQVATILYRLEKEPAVAYAPTFPDVMEDQWFASAVLWGNSKGILLGHDTGKFGPDDGVTFEQMLTILYRYAALKGYDTAARADVSGFECSDYAAEAVSWAMAHGMVSAADGAALKAPAARCQVAQVLAIFCQTVVMK